MLKTKRDRIRGPSQYRRINYVYIFNYTHGLKIEFSMHGKEFYIFLICTPVTIHFA